MAYKTVGWKNRFFLMVGPEDIMIDIGIRRFVIRWFSAEDGKTWSPALYTFTRSWKY